MPQFNTKNFAETKLLKSVDSKATDFIVENAGVLPMPPFRIVIGREIAEVKSKSRNKLTNIIRGIEDTTARSHNTGAVIKAIWTDGMLNKLSTNIKTVDNAQTAIEDTLTAQQFLDVRGARRFG